jgi:hypothetical protein
MKKGAAKAQAILEKHPEVRAVLEHLMKQEGAAEVVLPADLEATLDESLAFEVPLDTAVDLDQLAAVPPKATAPGSVSGARPLPATGSVPITIRIPVSTLRAFKARASSHGVPYQTLINRVLGAAVIGWSR